jgi:hypothetical protein
MPLQFDLLEPGLALSAMPRCAADLADTPFVAILNVCDFGSPRYATDRRRHLIVGAVHEFLAGNVALLDAARHQRDD